MMFIEQIVIESHSFLEFWQNREIHVKEEGKGGVRGFIFAKLPPIQHPQVTHNQKKIQLCNVKSGKKKLKNYEKGWKDEMTGWKDEMTVWKNKMKG